MFSTIRNTLVTGPRQRNVALAEFLTNNGKHFRQILSVEKAQVQSGNESIHEAWFGRTWPTASDGSCIPKEASASKKGVGFLRRLLANALVQAFARVEDSIATTERLQPCKLGRRRWG